LKDHRLSLVAGFAMALVTLALVGYQLSLAPPASAAAKATTLHKSQSKVAPRNIKKANPLVRLTVTELVRNYAKGRTKTVCSLLTAKLRKALGGSAKCAATIRRTRSSTPISKATIKKIAFRSARTLATVTGYLNGNRKQRLSVVLKWEGGRYRLDHSVSALSGILR
jgi:hypothetical protein